LSFSRPDDLLSFCAPTIFIFATRKNQRSTTSRQVSKRYQEIFLEISGKACHSLDKGFKSLKMRTREIEGNHQYAKYRRCREYRMREASRIDSVAG
jgi:hypothetical protein